MSLSTDADTDTRPLGRIRIGFPSLEVLLLGGGGGGGEVGGGEEEEEEKEEEKEVRWLFGWLLDGYLDG